MAKVKNLTTEDFRIAINGAMESTADFDKMRDRLNQMNVDTIDEIIEKATALSAIAASAASLAASLLARERFQQNAALLETLRNQS